MLLGVNDHPLFPWTSADPNLWFASWLDVACRRHLDILRVDLNYLNMPPDQQITQLLRLLTSRSVKPLFVLVGPSNPTSMPDPFVYAGVAAHLASLMSSGFFEIWNEPNLAPNFWVTPPNAGAYAHLVAAALPAIKQANPNLTVLAGSIVFNDNAYISAFLNALPQGGFDGLSLHPYGANFYSPPDCTSAPIYSFTGAIASAKAALAAHGLSGVQLHVSEYGLDVSDAAHDETSASYYRAARDAAEKAGIASFSAFHLGSRQQSGSGTQMALLRTDLSETLAWQAFMAGR